MWFSAGTACGIPIALGAKEPAARDVCEDAVRRRRELKSAHSKAHAYRRATVFVDKILKGSKRAPAKLELAINLKTAKQIDLTIPPTVLARADTVIKEGLRDGHEHQSPMSTHACFLLLPSGSGAAAEENPSGRISFVGRCID
jgi:hypothetical protein